MKPAQIKGLLDVFNVDRPIDSSEAHEQALLQFELDKYALDVEVLANSNLRPEPSHTAAWIAMEKQLWRNNSSKLANPLNLKFFEVMSSMDAYASDPALILRRIRRGRSRKDFSGVAQRDVLQSRRCTEGLVIQYGKIVHKLRKLKQLDLYRIKLLSSIASDACQLGADAGALDERVDPDLKALIGRIGVSVFNVNAVSQLVEDTKRRLRRPLGDGPSSAQGRVKGGRRKTSTIDSQLYAGVDFEGIAEAVVGDSSAGSVARPSRISLSEFNRRLQIEAQDSEADQKSHLSSDLRSKDDSSVGFRVGGLSSSRQVGRHRAAGKASGTGTGTGAAAAAAVTAELDAEFQKTLDEISNQQRKVVESLQLEVQLWSVPKKAKDKSLLVSEATAAAGMPGERDLYSHSEDVQEAFEQLQAARKGARVEFTDKAALEMVACLDSTVTSLFAKGLVSPADMERIQRSVEEELHAEGIAALSPQLTGAIAESTDPGKTRRSEILAWQNLLDDLLFRSLQSRWGHVGIPGAPPARNARERNPSAAGGATIGSEQFECAHSKLLRRLRDKHALVLQRAVNACRPLCPYEIVITDDRHMQQEAAAANSPHHS